MNAKSIVVASTLLLASVAGAADRVDPAQLPAAVRQSFEAAARGDAIREFKVHVVNGRTVYDLELERKNAPNPRLRIAADGEMLAEATAIVTADLPLIDPEFGGVAAAVPPRLTLAEVPAAVRQAIEREAKGRELGTIERESRAGAAGYRVTFRESGRNPEVRIAEDGTLLQPGEKRPALLIGTRFEETPAAVQQAIRREAGDAEIVRIDRERGGRNEPVSFKVDLKDTRGTFQVRVAEDGRLLEHSRTSAPPKRG
jgi:hypothetical protein